MAAEKHELSLMDAVDNLSAMAELDTVAPEEVGEEGIESRRVIKWIKPSKVEESQEDVKQTFRVLHHYLKHLYEEDRARLKDPETRKGIQAIMVLAGEAAQKVDRFSSLFQSPDHKASVTDLPEYQELQKFYLTKMVKRFQETLAEEEAWQAEWGQSDDEVVFDIEKRGLKDLETVRRDREYELFYLKKEDGRPFYNKNLLRHIRLVGNFDEAISDFSEEDPILRIQEVLGHDLLASAREILDQSLPYIDIYYNVAFKHKDRPFVAVLNKAIMALMLAANPRNSIDSGSPKTTVAYYSDFHNFLREAMSMQEYYECLTAAPTADNPLIRSLINLSHVLCCYFFMRKGSRQECVNLIHNLIKEGETNRHVSRASFWASLLDEDEHLRYLLAKFPNGPVLKTLDVLHDQQEGSGFDPLLQGNFPRQLFSFSCQSQHITCLHLPSPIHQEVIDKAEIVEEFKGVIRCFSQVLENQKLLIVNLQDRTSWQDRTRALVLEKLQHEAEFAKNLSVVSLPKNTDFYMQGASYLQESRTDEFIQQFLQQIEEGEECGFYFPKEVPRDQLIEFSKTTLQLISEHIFKKQDILSRKNRLDFIEIFYQFLTLKIIEWTTPDSISFSCKDGVDTGAATVAGFYLFVHLLEKGDCFNQEEKEAALWLFYAPALLVRERAIDAPRLQRTISALSVLSESLKSNREGFLGTFNAKDLRIQKDQ